jgi:hypothetical protein
MELDMEMGVEMMEEVMELKKDWKRGLERASVDDDVVAVAMTGNTRWYMLYEVIEGGEVKEQDCDYRYCCCCNY